MRHFILLLILAFSLSVSAHEPNDPPKGKPDFRQIVEKRYEVIVHELNLDDRKAKAVKPIYMEYCKKCGELFKPKGPRKPIEQCSDTEAEAMIKDNFKKSREILTLRETYYNQLRKYLSPKQLIKIYDIERREQRMIRDHHNKQRK